MGSPLVLQYSPILRLRGPQAKPPQGHRGMNSEVFSNNPGRIHGPVPLSGVREREWGSQRRPEVQAQALQPEYSLAFRLQRTHLPPAQPRGCSGGSGPALVACGEAVRVAVSTRGREPQAGHIEGSLQSRASCRSTGVTWFGHVPLWQLPCTAGRLVAS